MPLQKRPLVELENVEKDYRADAVAVPALVGINLRIEAGEFVAVVGPSGSGKSTLMNVVGCLDRPTRGIYRIEGIDVGKRSNDARALVRNRMVGFLFQNSSLLFRSTALENVELPLVYRGVPRRERRERARAALAQVGLEARKHLTPNQLTHGQQQRVAIARALATSPPLLLADEPTGNLDTATSYEVLALLQWLNADLGITVMLATHEPDIARCARRSITMRDARVRLDVPHTPVDASSLLESSRALAGARG
jgi:putative ABC transport system ATP-binding protein